MVVGLGARQSATPEELEEIILAVLKEQYFDIDNLTLIASIDRADTARAISQVAAKLMKPMVLYPVDRLREEADRCQTNSPISMEKTGVGSVAEASALAALSEDAVLVAPRIKHATATAALAIVIPTNDPDRGLLQ